MPTTTVYSNCSCCSSSSSSSSRSSTTECCPIVAGLTAEGTGDSINLEYTNPGYLKRGVFFGDFCTVSVGCLDGVWHLTVSHEPGSPCALTSNSYQSTDYSCNPIEVHFTGVSFCGVVTDLVITE